MKVYVHIEEIEGPTHTIGRQINKESLQDILNDFVIDYKKAYNGFDIVIGNVQLVNTEGRSLHPLSREVISFLSNKDDIILQKISSSQALIIPIQVKKSVDVLDGNGKDNNSLYSSKELTDIKKNIDTLITAKSYRQARILCEKSILSAPQESHVFLGNLAGIKLANHEYDMAVKYANMAIAAAKKNAVDTSIYSLSLAEALFGSVDQFDEADEVLEKMLMKKFPSHLSNTFTLDVRTLRAECLFNMNQHETAANFVNEHMHWEGGENHLPTLLAYSRFAITYRKIEEPIRAMLKAIVIDQKNPQSRKMLSDLLGTMLYMYIYVYIFIYIFVYMHIFICMCINIYTLRFEMNIE
jgi:tetratricopeptide (TPR) repeat protein